MAVGAPPDTRPAALVLGGIRRGFLVVFLPVALAAQAVAFLAFAITGAYGPWSWAKIGLAYALMSARVPFGVTVRRAITTLGAEAPLVESTLAVALGALTVAVLVLAFRAGTAQARGLERMPGPAAAAGAAIGVGFALPMIVAALLVRLSFPRAGMTGIEPVAWAAFVLPLTVGTAAGAVGGLAAARAALAEGPLVWAMRAARAGALMLWWGLVLATIGFLILAVVRPSATGWYARTVGDAGAGGAVVVVHHALLLPNQSAMILAAASGSPVTLTAGETTLVSVSLTSFDATGLGGEPVALGPGYLAFLLVPALGAVLGGRAAGEGARSRRAAIASGALAGVAAGVLAGLLAWASSIQAPLPGIAVQGSLGSSPVTTAALATAWGIAGGVVGALIGPGETARAASAQVTSA
jgi:hypothetical protein